MIVSMRNAHAAAQAMGIKLQQHDIRNMRKRRHDFAQKLQSLALKVWRDRA